MTMVSIYPHQGEWNVLNDRGMFVGCYTTLCEAMAHAYAEDWERAHTAVPAERDQESIDR